MSLIIDDIGGNCPVQAEGFFDGIPFYFRARGSHWSLDVGVEGETSIESFFEKYSDDVFAAGWMEEEEAKTFIKQCYDKWAAVDRPRVWYPTNERLPKILPESRILLFNRAMTGDYESYPYIIVHPEWMHRMGESELLYKHYTHWMLLDDPESVRKTYFKQRVYDV